MTSREGFLAALTGATPDRPPLAHVAALTTVELQEQTGCWMPDVHHDPEQLVRLLAANHEVLGFDAVSFIINYFNEPAALGAAMNWGTPGQLPTFASHPWQESEPDGIPENLLDIPPVSTCLAALRMAKMVYGDQVAVLGKVMGPLSMVQAMVGVEQAMIAMIDAPERIGRLLEIAVDVLVQCGNAQFDAGIDALSIGEGGAGANMLSPDMYGRLLMPHHKIMISRLKGPTIMHMCGNILPRLRMLQETGITCFNFDWDIDPRIMVEAAAGHFSVMGNVSTTDLLNAGPAEIRRQVTACIDAGVNIISPGCAVSPRCPNANFIAMADAIRTTCS